LRFFNFFFHSSIFPYFIPYRYATPWVISFSVLDLSLIFFMVSLPNPFANLLASLSSGLVHRSPSGLSLRVEDFSEVGSNCLSSIFIILLFQHYYFYPSGVQHFDVIPLSLMFLWYFSP